MTAEISIGDLIPTKIPGLSDDADIQQALRLYHYGSYTYSPSNTSPVNLVSPSMAKTIYDIQQDITTLDSLSLKASIFTSKGSLLSASAPNVLSLLSVGVNNQVLIANSATSSGLEWSGTLNGITLSSAILTTPTIGGGGANFSGSVSGTTNLRASSAAGSTTITLPAVTGTVVTTGDTGTVTNTMLAGSIANNKLSNSSITVGSTAISLGATSTTLAGLTSVTSTSFIGALTGNADTVTNGIYTSGSYSNPSWITSLAWSKISGTPTTLSGYGITDALSNSTTSTQSGYFGDIFLYDDSTPSHYLQITNSANLTAARILSLNVNDAARTISLSGNLTVSADATISGTNTGNQTITLTGDITGTGTGSFATTLATVATAGTYKSITINNKGLVTSGTNPTTLSGYGITDAAALAGATFTGQVQSTRANNTGDGLGQIYLNGATGNRIDFNTAGGAAPSFTTRSAGTKIVLYPAVAAASVDHAIGVEGFAHWVSVPTSASHSFKWYGGTTVAATLSGAGAFSTTSTISASGLAGSLLTSTPGTALGTASAGSSAIPAQSDHVHPTTGLALLTGATFTGSIIAPAATTSITSIRLPHGAAPTSPTNGDIWTTTAGIFVRVNGATVGPLGTGGGSGVTTISFGTTGLTPNTATSGAVTVAGTLLVANGGTGVTTSTGTGSVVLGTSPTITGGTFADAIIRQLLLTPTFTTNAYTLLLTDQGDILLASNGATAGTINIPTNASVAFPIGTQITIIQTGAGQITVTATTPATTTIASTGGVPTSPKLRTQNASATLIKTNTDTWYVVGDIS